MDLEEVREHCLQKPGASEDFPFGEETLVFRVLGKIFVLTNLYRDPPALNLKCDPERALELREQYPAVQPGYHMNKRHWNTVELDGTIPDDELLELIDHSYELVARGLKRDERRSIGFE